jgi:hypothetical protein
MTVQEGWESISRGSHPNRLNRQTGRDSDTCVLALPYFLACPKICGYQEKLDG